MPKILAVDDSNSMRQMVSVTLKQAGFQVTEAVDGVDGLSKAGREKYDLVLSDINMPQMDGISMIKNIRTLDSYRHTPILMLTTESSSEMKQQGRSAGATGWIVKPFDPEQLVSVVRRVLG